LESFFLLFVVVTLLFFLFRLLPGSYVDLMVYQGASESAVDAFEQKWRLNEPLYVQYYYYVINVLQGDMGTSLQFRRPVLDVVKQRMFNTFILVAPGVTTGYIIAGVLGGVIGNFPDSRLEKGFITGVIIIGTVPLFLYGVLFIIVFSSWLNIFPTSGMITPAVSDRLADEAWWRIYVTKDFAMHYILPFSAIVLRYVAQPSLIMLTSVHEAINQPFTKYHRITGLPFRNRVKHIAKHASLPLLTLYPISMTRAISGLVLIEIVFNWPGIGFTVVEAVLSRDTPVIQFVFFISAAFIIFANFAVDIAYGIIDPRISLSND
jgi:peptide/nickel transport system permease protein